jgi:hypothetical protein
MMLALLLTGIAIVIAADLFIRIRFLTGKRGKHISIQNKGSQ